MLISKPQTKTEKRQGDRQTEIDREREERAHAYLIFPAHGIFSNKAITTQLGERERDRDRDRDRDRREKEETHAYLIFSSPCIF